MSRRRKRGWGRGHGGIADVVEMKFIAVFLGEEIGKVVGAGNMLDGDKAGRLQITDCLLAHLKVAETFGGAGVGPVDRGLVVVVDGDGGGHERVLEMEVGEDVGEMKDGFDAFVGGVNLGLC